jgi:hypothetical protein
MKLFNIHVASERIGYALDDRGYFLDHDSKFMFMTRLRLAHGSTKQLEGLSNKRFNNNTIQMTATVIFLSSSGGHTVPFLSCNVGLFFTNELPEWEDE